MDISQLRTTYANKVFTDEEESLPDPFTLFECWFKNALECGIIEPNAMCLSTCTSDGKPSSRYVLMKSYSKDGFIFYSNYESRKGKELSENPQACILFYWQLINRQIRIEGTVERISDTESIKYFKTRPKESQASAVVSQQSRVAPSRLELEAKVKECLCKYTDKDIPKPDNWGGYLLRPSYFEFWQGHTSRLHDRITFKRNKSDETWTIARLYP